MPDEWLRVMQAAKLMGVNRSTIYDWIHEKKILPSYIRVSPTGTYIINKVGLVRPLTDRRVKKQRKVRVKKLTW